MSYDDCCLKYVRKVSRSIKIHAVDYRRQEADGGCNINAVMYGNKLTKTRDSCLDCLLLVATRNVRLFSLLFSSFIMRKGHVLCTNPKHGWVIELVKKLDKKKVRDGQRVGDY